MKKLKPIDDLNRIAFLDVLRGMSIFFIFTANIPFFSGLWFFQPDSPVRQINWASDATLSFIHYVLVDGKFYSIFSLLFGIGCAIQYNNALARGKSFASFFTKRMVWLFIFGAIHLILFWAGDILTLYALLGFVLTSFVAKSNKTLLITAAILILFPIMNWSFMHFTGLYYPNIFFNTQTDIYQYFNFKLVEMNGELMPDFQSYLLNTSVADFFKMNFGNAFVRVGMILNEGRVFKVFGIFLIGLWTGRKIINDNLLTQKTFLKQVFWIGLVWGLPFNLFRGYLEFFGQRNTLNEFLHTLSYALGTVPLALSIAAGIALVCLKYPTVLAGFKPVGKMALTCYLSHTLIGIILFYGFGFNLAGKFGFTVIMIFAICIFVLQIILSKLWLQYHNQGPLEWLWRKLLY